MKITLANGVELFPIMATGKYQMVHGVRRDTLTFVFPVETSLDEMDEIFTSSNCKNIKITDDQNNEYIHSDYTVRVDISRKPVVTQEACSVTIVADDGTVSTEEKEEVIEQRVMVSMAQSTYSENQLSALQDAVDMISMEDMEV